VKNNLQVILAMIEMQEIEHGSDRGAPLKQFARLKTHVKTLAIVHELLSPSCSEAEDLQFVSIREVLHRLLPLLREIAPHSGLVLGFNIADISLPSKFCVSISLVVNELVANALKHARCAAAVNLSEQNGEIVLEVCDDGPGFPMAFNPITYARIGLELVESLVQTDLSGRIHYENQEHGGARARVVFNVPAPFCIGRPL
jgi:two-component sensor histidine kinase